jgi:hypothetical protein
MAGLQNCTAQEPGCRQEAPVQVWQLQWPGENERHQNRRQTLQVMPLGFLGLSHCRCAIHI